MTTSTTSSSIASSSISSSLLKQLRATAGVQAYDYVFSESCTKLEEQQRKIHQFFHGNADLNIVSQVELLCKGHGKYSSIYEEYVMATTEGTDTTSTTTNTNTNKKLFVKEMFYSASDTHRYSPGRDFTVSMIASPVKSKPDEKASGRYLYDLARHAIKNIKKACVIADGWLNDGELPSGKTWKDLYQHVLSEHEGMNPKEKIFIGFMAFVLLTKYKDGGQNHLSILAASNVDLNNRQMDGTRASGARKKAKVEKDEDRSRGTASVHSPFSNRSLTMDLKLQVMEVAQLQDQKTREYNDKTILQLNSKRDSLLTERTQAIDLAKTLCPDYDEEDENWMAVKELSSDIKQVKQLIKAAEKKRESYVEDTNTYSNLVNEFLSSVTNLFDWPQVKF